MHMESQEDAAVRARELHERAIVIDCHSDILIPITDGFVRMGTQVDIPDPERYEPPFEIEAKSPPWMLWPHSNRFGCIGQYSLPQFQAGGLTGFGGGLTATHENFLARGNRFKLRWKSTVKGSHKVTLGVHFRRQMPQSYVVALGYRLRPRDAVLASAWARYHTLRPFAERAEGPRFTRKTPRPNLILTGSEYACARR